LSRRFDLASARAAASAGETALWVGDFLASRGSDNAVLAAALAQERHWWLGPVRIPLGDLERLSGPEDEVLVHEEPRHWEGEIDEMRERLEEGWEPPPLLAEYQDGRLLLQDGNHRYEALAREGAPDAWVLIYFGDPDSRDAFARSIGEVTRGE
jgi:hypothetical protein